MRLIIRCLNLAERLFQDEYNMFLSFEAVLKEVPLRRPQKDQDKKKNLETICILFF